MQNHNPAYCGPRYPMVDPREVGKLASLYGEPIRRCYDVRAGGSILEYRWRKDSDRRAEVVFAIQGPGEQIWLHTKHQYERPMFRLPTGGIEWEESVLDALLREVEEEAGVQVEIQRFAGLVEYQFYQVSPNEQGASAEYVRPSSTAQQRPTGQGSMLRSSSQQGTEPTLTSAKFASYIFLLKNLEGRLVAHNNEEVAEFKSIMPSHLPGVSAGLRNVIGPRREWGHWRAIAHDVLYEALHRVE